MLETEIIDRLFLELSQFTQSTTKTEAEQQLEIERLRAAWHTAIEVGSEWKRERDECRRLLREAVDYPNVELPDDWYMRAKKAGGE